MPECVGIDVGQTVPLAEFVHPVCNGIRVHGFAVILCKYKSLVLVVFAFMLLILILPIPVGATSATKTLKVAYEQNNPYYAYEDAEGKTVGLQVDILNAIADEMGIAEIEYHPYGNMESCILAMENGEVDVVLGFPMLYDGDTSNIMISSEIHTVDLSMLASRETAAQIRSGELTSYTAVFEHNINNYKIVSNLGARLYFVVGTQEELVESVLSGKAQAMVCDENCVAAILKNRDYEDEFETIRSNITTVGYAIAVPKGADTLLRSINDGIIKLRMSGQYDIILRRWSKSTIDVDKLIKTIVIVASIASIMLVAYLLFSWRLRRVLKMKIAEVTDELDDRLQQLQQESHLRNQIIEHAPNMMLLCDANQNTILMNAAARKLTGCVNSNGIQLPVQQLPVIGDLVQAALQKMQLETMGTIADVIVGYRREKGENRSYRCTIIEAHLGNSGKGYLLIVSDITAEEAKKQEMIEKEKSVALSRLVAGIAHEVKNPLTGIQNFADMIISERENPQFWGYFAEYVPKEIGRISKLIESLMNYARPAKGVKTPTEVAPLIRESMYLLNTTAASNVSINVELEEGMWIFVEQDRIKQVLINILLNSLEAVELRSKSDAEPGKQYQITVAAYRQMHEIVIRLEDQGIGMSQEELQSCMDPFFTTKEKGTGLGLAISRQFVQENGGAMSIDSVKQEGTIIVLRFREMDYEQKNLDY